MDLMGGSIEEPIQQSFPLWYQMKSMRRMTLTAAIEADTLEAREVESTTGFKHNLTVLYMLADQAQTLGKYGIFTGQVLATGITWNNI